MSKRFYFQNYQESDLQTVDVWTVTLPGPMQFTRLMLPRAIATKVRVAYLRVGNYSAFTHGDPLPGLLFDASNSVGWGAIMRCARGTTISIKLVKDHPLFLEDCALFLDEDGKRQSAIGWLE